MKRIILLFVFILLLISLAACNTNKTGVSSQSEPSTPQSSQTESQISPAESQELSSEEEPTAPDAVYVADAAMYRGTVTEIEAQENNEYLIHLQQYQGTSYGAPLIQAIINSDTRSSTAPDTIKAGDYLEIFYGGPIEAGIDEALIVIGMNNLGEAESRNYNGVIQEITLGEESGTGSVKVRNLSDTEDFVFNYDQKGGTQFYLNMDSFVVGAKINIFHDIAVTKSIPPQAFALEIQLFNEI